MDSLDAQQNSHQAMLKLFSTPDPKTEGVFLKLKEIYPFMAKKVFESGDFMARFYRSGYNTSSVLDAYICGKCESLAAWDGYGRKNGKEVPKCTCFKCGTSTVAPVTLREWMMDELKKKMPKSILEGLDWDGVDAVAMGMFNKANAQLQSMLRYDPRNNEQP